MKKNSYEIACIHALADEEGRLLTDAELLKAESLEREADGLTEAERPWTKAEIAAETARLLSLPSKTTSRTSPMPSSLAGCVSGEAVESWLLSDKSPMQRAAMRKNSQEANELFAAMTGRPPAPMRAGRILGCIGVPIDWTTAKARAARAACVNAWSRLRRA